MANEQYAFIDKSRVPSKAEWQAAVESGGFNLKITYDFEPFEHSGFLPCSLFGVDSGVEVYYTPAAEVFYDPSIAEALAGNRDYCISFRWGGDFREGACAMILSYALASTWDAVVSYEGEAPPVDLESFRSETESMIKEAMKQKG